MPSIEIDKAIADLKEKRYAMRVCDNPSCRKEYKPVKEWQKYCTPQCGKGKWNNEHIFITKDDYVRLLEIEKQFNELKGIQ